jgi:hypothetical protein
VHSARRLQPESTARQCRSGPANGSTQSVDRCVSDAGARHAARQGELRGSDWPRPGSAGSPASPAFMSSGRW